MPRSLYPRFSDHEYADRYARVHRLMEEHRLAALVLYGDSGNNRRNQANIYYLTQYMDRHFSYFVIGRDDARALFVGLYNHLPNARALSVIRDVRWAGPAPAEAVAKELERQALSRARIGIVGLGGPRGLIPYDHHIALRRRLPRAQWVDVTRLVIALRLVKSREEIVWLRRGAHYTDLALEGLIRHAKPGIREFELAWGIEAAYLRQGGETHFYYLSSTNMRAPARYVPWQSASRRRLRSGDIILTEISAAYGAYTGQIHRPIALRSTPSPRYRALYAAAEETYARVAQTMRVGAQARDVVRAARPLREAGYTICDSLVHGFGVDLLPPTIGVGGAPYGPASDFTFRENMAVVIQPNPIARDGRAGLQLGNLCLVTDVGAVPLQKYPLGFLEV